MISKRPFNPLRLKKSFTSLTTSYLEELLSSSGAQWIAIYECFLGTSLYFPLVVVSQKGFQPDPFFQLIHTDEFPPRDSSPSSRKNTIFTFESPVTHKSYDLLFYHASQKNMPKNMAVMAGCISNEARIKRGSVTMRMPRLLSIFQLLSKDEKQRCAIRTAPLIKKIRKHFFQTLSYQETVSFALKEYSRFINAVSFRLYLHFEPKEIKPVYASFDGDVEIDSEGVHAQFRALMERKQTRILPGGSQQPVNLTDSKGFFLYLENSTINCHFLVLFPALFSLTKTVFSSLREMFLQLSDFFEETIIMNKQVTDYSLNRDLHRAAKDLLVLHELDDFFRTAAEIVNEFLHVDSTALYIWDKEKKQLCRFEYAGKIAVTPSSACRPLEYSSFLAQCARTGNSILKTTLTKSDKKKVLDNREFSSVLYYPIKEQDALLGVIKIADRRTSKITFSHLHRLSILEPYLLLAFQNNRKYQHLTHQLFRDYETDLLNRRGFENYVEKTLKQSKKQGNSFSIMMMSIDRPDRFLSISSVKSHRHLLRSIRRMFMDILPKTITIAYSGEDTFWALVPGKDLTDALTISRQFCKNSHTLHFEKAGPLTFSVGVSSFPINGMSVEELMLSAEQAMTISRYQGGDTSSIMGSHILKKLSLDIFSGFLGKRSFQTGPELADGVLEKISSSDDRNGLTVLEVINSLVEAIDAKDHYTSKHTMETSMLSVALARRMGLDDQSIERLRIAARLHDVGKIGIPEKILLKKHNLTKKEMDLVKKHPEIGAKILRPITSLRNIADIVEHHHERWDGNGYPEGLKGEEIPLESRILSVVDTFHAMISTRPYREALPRDLALEEIARSAEEQFDPHVTGHFLEMMQEQEVCA